MDQEQDSDDARSPNVFERPHEAEILGGGAPQPGESGGTVEPWEEPENTQGFQHGSWNYDHDVRERIRSEATEPAAQEPE